MWSRKITAEFGIVAAMSRNGIIGINGRLPWNLPLDRKFFQDLTSNKVLILGRNTWNECLDRSHVSQARAVIIVSKTLSAKQQQPQIIPSSKPTRNEKVVTAEYSEESSLSSSLLLNWMAVPTFPEAIDHWATKLTENQAVPTKNETVFWKSLDCWVVGGEGIYREALLHPSARFLHLTIVDIDIPTTTTTDSSTNVARFPDPQIWKHQFVPLHSSTSPPPLIQQQHDGDLTFTTHLYQRSFSQGSETT